MKAVDIEKEIYTTFSEIASNIGYSEIHGRIIAALLVEGKSMSLQDLSKKIGYSVSTISLSLDLLELLGMIKKKKNVGDRNLYVQIQGNLIEGLKKAFLFKTQKSIDSSVTKFEKYKDDAKKLNASDRKRIMETINALEKEIMVLDKYVRILSSMKLPFK